MHIPDGFLSTPMWAGLAAVSVPSIGALARRAQAQVEESRIPLLGVMGAFVFAAQMINFPVAAGASGHLVGGALLAIALGPSAAAVVLTSVLLIQALVFQDGGLLALGANIFNMAIAGVLAGYLPSRWFGPSGWQRRAGVFLGGFLSVFTAASLCLGELALSGVKMPQGAVVLSIGVFTLTGLIEGAITLAVLDALAKLNPKWLRAPRADRRPVLAVFGIAAVLLASTGFLFASALPDGLERFATAAGFAANAQTIVSSPMPDYEMVLVGNPWLRKAGAGLAGLMLSYALCWMAGRWIARWRNA